MEETAAVPPTLTPIERSAEPQPLLNSRLESNKRDGSYFRLMDSCMGRLRVARFRTSSVGVGMGAHVDDTAAVPQILTPIERSAVPQPPPERRRREKKR